MAFGLGFGWATGRAFLRTQDVAVSFPVLQITGYVVLAGLAAFLASVIPARRAARRSVIEGLAPAAGILKSTLAPQPVGGLPLLSQPAFLILVAGDLILVAGDLIVAAAVLAGLRRTALAAPAIAAAADYTQWTAFHLLQPGAGTTAFLTTAVFLLEAIALASVDSRAARRREGWQLVFPALALAVAAQLLALSLDAARAGGIVFRNGGELHTPSGNSIMVIGCVLALLAVLLPLPLGLGWRASLLLAAACYPLVILASAVFGPSSVGLPRPWERGQCRHW